jgi:ubiquinone/menaquinone biosynthesis C-methylase UbiE
LKEKIHIPWYSIDDDTLEKWKKLVVERYEKEAATYDQKRYKRMIGAVVDKIQKRRMLKIMKPTKADVILEVGYGTGRWITYFNDLGYNINGVDPSENMRKEARKKNTSKVPLLKGDMENIPFDDNKFDHVFTMKVTRHLPNKIITQGIKEMLRVTKPGGKVYIDFPHVGLISNISHFIGLSKPCRSRLFSYSDIEVLTSKNDSTYEYSFPRYMPEIKLNSMSYINYVIDLMPFLRKAWYSQVIVVIKKNKSQA